MSDVVRQDFDGVVMEIDNSQLTVFNLCPAKYRYVYHDLLGQTVGDAAHFSSCMVHPPIVGWYGGGGEFDWDGAWKAYEAIASTPGEAPYTLDRAKSIFAQFIEQFAPDQKEFEFVCGETTFSVDLGFGRFISKPDLVLRDKTTGELGVQDIKMSKYGVGAELSPFDRQFVGQAVATKAKWMMKAHIQVLMRETRITRSYCPVLPGLVKEWEQELKLEYAWLEKCMETGVWPKHAPASCTAYFTQCEFADLCALSVGRTEEIERRPQADPYAYLRGE